MKYIKTFEKTIFYSIGDYIKLTDESQLNIPIYKIIKILDILSFNEKYVIEIISNDFLLGTFSIIFSEKNRSQSFPKSSLD